MRAYRSLIDAEAARAESDLSSFRSRAVTVVTTSSGIVTLMTGVFTWAASKAEDEKGLPNFAILLLAVSLAAFLLAAIVALTANRGGEIDRPSGPALQVMASEPTWSNDASDASEEERKVAKVIADYVCSVRKLSDDAARLLNLAIGLQILGLAAVATSGLIAMTSLN